MLDLKQPDDAAVLHGLIRWADVMVENWRPGVADRLGLDDESIDALNPKLVHINITGWGTTGPWADRSAFDGLLQSFSGVAWSAGTKVVPSLLRFYLVDKVTGVFAAQSALAGLVRVARTGRGERIDVNMLDASAYFNFPDVFTERVLCDSTEEVDPENAPTTITSSIRRWSPIRPMRRRTIQGLGCTVSCTIRPARGPTSDTRRCAVSPTSTPTASPSGSSRRHTDCNRETPVWHHPNRAKQRGTHDERRPSGTRPAERLAARDAGQRWLGALRPHRRG